MFLDGASLVGGTLNGAGALTMEVTAVGDDTALANILRIVSSAQLRKPKVQFVLAIKS